MSAAQTHRAPWELPESYVAIPISADQQAAALRVCAVVRREPDPVAGRLVSLRDTIDARVLLGCIADARNRVHDWVELWVQDLDRLGETTHAFHEAVSNRVFDDRWQGHVQAFAEADPDSVILTGWEEAHPLPCLFDVEAAAPVHLVDSDSPEPWTLCTDDARLSGAGLPPYATSLHRYLHRASDESTPFVPVTRDALRNDRTKEFDDLLAGRDLEPFNPGGGRLLVRRYQPLGYEEFVDLLGGKEWTGPLHGRTPLDLGSALRAVARRDGQQMQGGDRLFLGSHGRWGRLIETLHLKLRALADAASSVREIVARTKRPILNLTAESIRVRLVAPGTGLPTLWTARPTLVDAGQAIRLPLSTGSAQYFLRGSSPISIYFPGSASAEAAGRGMVRIRRVLDDRDGQVIIEGTLATQERVTAATHDLLWLRINLKAGRVDLYGLVEQDSALAAGEWRFRTVGQKYAPEVMQQLKEAEGVPLQNTPFEVIPLLSSPCDLYALAVLAVRTLLVDAETSLPVALDELMSLARAADNAHDETANPSLAVRIEGLFDGDERWRASLGPHRLVQEAIDPADARDVVPAQLWWETLALVVRMLPGVGRDSFCRDLGDAEAGGLHRVFDPVREELERLITRTRSLIVIDWKFNREVHSVIRGYLVGTAG